MSKEDGDRDEICDLKSFSEVISWSDDMMSEKSVWRGVFLPFVSLFFLFLFLQLLDSNDLTNDELSRLQLSFEDP